MLLIRAFMLLLSLVSTLIYGQQQMPSDIDLKSAYCLTVVQHRINMAQPFEGQLDPSSKTGSELIRTQATSRDDVQRLRTYLLSKSQFLDVTALLGAKQRAEADVVTSNADGHTCVVSCTGQNDPGPEALTPKVTSCIDRCVMGSGAAARMRSCVKVDWLPY